MPCWPARVVGGELVAIPNVEDYKKLAQKIHASFEIPRVRCEALKVMNDYSMPPAPKCVERKLFATGSGPQVALPGLPWEATPEDLGLCPSSTVLSWKSKTHHMLVKYAIWQDVSRTWDGLWSLSSHSAIVPSWKRQSLTKGLRKQRSRDTHNPAFHQLCQPMNQSSQPLHQ